MLSSGAASRRGPLPRGAAARGGALTGVTRGLAPSTPKRYNHVQSELINHLFGIPAGNILTVQYICLEYRQTPVLLLFCSCFLTKAPRETTSVFVPLSGPPKSRDLAPHFYGLRTERIRSSQLKSFRIKKKASPGDS